MKKNFTVTLPDEPYKLSTALNKTVQCVYEGSRYIVARMETATKIVTNTVWEADLLDQIDLDRFVEEGCFFFVIDAASKPFEAAFVSNRYTHGEIENYEETLPTGEKWTHSYENSTGLLGHIYFPHSLKYDPATETFDAPVRRTHFITRDSFFASLTDIPARIQEALDINDYTDEERTALEDYKTWLENLSVTYANVDHWKIPFPANLPSF